MEDIRRGNGLRVMRVVSSEIRGPKKGEFTIDRLYEPFAY